MQGTQRTISVGGGSAEVYSKTEERATLASIPRSKTQSFLPTILQSKAEKINSLRADIEKYEKRSKTLNERKEGSGEGEKRKIEKELSQNNSKLTAAKKKLQELGGVELETTQRNINASNQPREEHQAKVEDLRSSQTVKEPENDDASGSERTDSTVSVSDEEE